MRRKKQIGNNVAFCTRGGIRVLRNIVENQDRADAQTSENFVSKHSRTMLQTKEKGLHQIFNGGREKVLTFSSRAKKRAHFANLYAFQFRASK